MKTFLLLIAVTGFCLTASQPALGQTYTYSFQQGISPTTGYSSLGADIRSGNSNYNDGGSSQMLVGYSAQDLRSLLAFNLSAIPANQVITSITLTLTQYTATAGGGTASGLGTLDLSQITPNGSAGNAAVEGTNTTGLTSATSVNWATWNGTTAWTRPGGDFGTALSTTAAQDPTSLAGLTYTFSSSASFIAAAQNALSSGTLLQLIVTAPTAESATGATNYIRFFTDDINNGEAPLLTITTTAVPEPSALSLIFGGCALFAFSRLREARSVFQC